MSNGTLDDLYLEWLYAKIGVVRTRNPHRSFWHLARQLYTIPFEWSIRNDDNRSEDGMDLRFEFLDEQGLTEVEPAWMGLQCSMLEMLVAFSHRVYFESTGTPGGWFWHLLRNLGIDSFSDALYSTAAEQEIYQCVTRFLTRKYESNGRGGLFPLQWPRTDQRYVELWDQMSAYLLEGDYLDEGFKL